jgi:glutamate racemase
MVAGSDAPIGVFDSGIGGLTVVREIIRYLPDERTIYFGDTARVPYGPKSPDTVRRYSAEISSFLLDQGVKAIVIACNTATAHALPMLREMLPLPVIGVIEPGARAAVAATAGTVGVIGTKGTIASGAYERAIHAISAETRVVARACPLFVPFVEEGLTDGAAAQLVAEEYLRPFVEERVEALVLGCTHYPLLKPLIARIVGPRVRLIDSGRETALETQAALDAAGLRAPPSRGHDPVRRFIASDAPEQFLSLGQRFLGTAIERVETLTLG